MSVLWLDIFLIHPLPVMHLHKPTFIHLFLDLFKKRSKDGRGHVEFIRSALKHMKEYNLHKDIEIYKALLEVFPKGPLIAKNKYQVSLLSVAMYAIFIRSLSHKTINATGFFPVKFTNEKTIGVSATRFS